jgi:hypothetical protein
MGPPSTHAHLHIQLKRLLTSSSRAGLAHEYKKKESIETLDGQLSPSRPQIFCLPPPTSLQSALPSQILAAHAHKLMAAATL